VEYAIAFYIALNVGAYLLTAVVVTKLAGGFYE
jgi:hypothetical protein